MHTNKGFLYSDINSSLELVTHLPSMFMTLGLIPTNKEVIYFSPDLHPCSMTPVMYIREEGQNSQE